MTQPQRYKENPFIKEMVVPVKNSRVQISRIGADNNILINQSTGETQGTALTTYHKVDGEKFVKLFTANIGLTFELTAKGIKAFTVLMWAVQHHSIAKDEVILDTRCLEEFIESQAMPLKLSRQTFMRGLNELTRSQIIARTVRRGHYFINPNFVFNGDRIAFTTLIERSDTHNENQHEMQI